MKIALYLFTGLIVAGAVGLWDYSRQEDGRILDAVLAISQNSKGEVLATFDNRSRGRMLVAMSPNRIEVFDAGRWITPQYPGLICGNVDVEQDWVESGSKIKFRIYDRIELVRPGQSLRVMIYAHSGSSEGWVVSNAIVFSLPTNAQQGARANERIGHAACYRKHIEMKHRIEGRNAARGAPAPLVAHL
jgi:hypothetical protein